MGKLLDGKASAEHGVSGHELVTDWIWKLFNTAFESSVLLGDIF